MKGHMSQEDFMSGLRKIGLSVASGLGAVAIYKFYKSKTKPKKFKAIYGKTNVEVEFDEK